MLAGVACTYSTIHAYTKAMDIVDNRAQHNGVIFGPLGRVVLANTVPDLPMVLQRGGPLHHIALGAGQRWRRWRQRRSVRAHAVDHAAAARHATGDRRGRQARTRVGLDTCAQLLVLLIESESARARAERTHKSRSRRQDTQRVTRKHAHNVKQNLGFGIRVRLGCGWRQNKKNEIKKRYKNKTKITVLDARAVG